jgi:hypothetical protein
MAMISFRVSADVRDDHQITLTLPPEVPLGKNELIVTVAASPPEQPKRPRSSLAEWAEQNAENWGDRLNSEDVEGFTGRRF